MQDVIVLLILAVLIGAAIYLIRRSKKQGVTCIGCPHAKSCAAKAKGCGCGEKK